MSVDLHTHSTASDGTETPARIVELAAAAGLSAVALTDHDTLSGVPEARAAAERSGVELVPGVELSVDHDGRKLHLLVYFLEPGRGPLQDRLAELREGRTARNRRIITKLRDLGYDITVDDVLAQAGGEAVGRPHIADALVARGLFPNRSAVFTDLLHDGGVAYEERPRLAAAEAISLARDSGAVSVVAHPYTIDGNRASYRRLFEELAALGLGGIEVEYPEHPLPLRETLGEVARALGLVATGGSDFHGAGKPGIAVGRGRGSLNVPDDVVARLRSRRAS